MRWDTITFTPLIRIVESDVLRAYDPDDLDRALRRYHERVKTITGPVTHIRMAKGSLLDVGEPAAAAAYAVLP